MFSHGNKPSAVLLGRFLIAGQHVIRALAQELRRGFEMSAQFGMGPGRAVAHGDDMMAAEQEKWEVIE